MLCRVLSRRVCNSTRISLLLLSVVAAASCGRGGKPGVWARVDGTPIYRTEVEAIYRAREGALAGEAKPEQALSFKLGILNQLIDRLLLLKRASELKITVSNQEVEARLTQLRNPDSDESFTKQLKAQGTTPAELREQVRDDLILQKLIQEEIVSQVNITSAQVAAYYDHNKADFDVPEAAYHLAQIVVTPVPDNQVRNLMRDDARNEAEAERKIQALYQQVRLGKDFAKIAEEYSEDPSTAASGGDMGFVPVASIASKPGLSRALKSLRPGQITGIIHDRTGFRIVKLLGRVKAGLRPIADPGVQQSIRKTLADEKLELLKAAYIENLRDHARIDDYLAQEILESHGSTRAIR